MSVHPEVIIPSVTTGHVVSSEEMAVEWNRREITVPVVVDGTTNNLTMIEDYIDDAEPGDTLRFPEGPIGCSPFTVPKLLRLRSSGGRFASRFVPLADTADPIVTFDVPVPGDIWETYGAGLDGIGINLAAAPSATGILITDTSGWVQLNRFAIVGGALSIDNRGANGSISEFLLADAERFILVDGDTGMELLIHDGALARNTAGTTELGIEVVCSAGGTKGALNMANVRCTSGVSGGVETVQWLKMSAPSVVSLPLFATNVQFDNCIGGGPGMEFVNVYDINFKGWVNNGDAGAGPAVKIDGGGRYSFEGTFFGGGSPAKTFDLNGTIAGLKISGTTPTEKVVYFNGGSSVTDLDFQATVPAATALSQVTNDEAAFRAAAIKNWAYSNIYQPAGIGPTFVNSWANVGGTAAYYVKDSVGIVHVAGLVTGGSAQTIFTLPSGYRPAYTEHFAGVLDDGSTVVVEILNTGVVKAYATFPAPTVSISFSFRWGGG